MRINGLSYDPQKAKEIMTWDNGYARTDNRFAENTIYKKRTGEYFLYGRGGAGSEYAQPVKSDPGSMGEGDIIRPLTIEETKNLILKNEENSLNDDVYEREFGAIKQDTKKVIKTYSLKQSTADKIDRIAKEQGKTRGEIIDQVFENE